MALEVNKMRSMKWCLVIVTMIMAAGVANASVLAFDDFSSGNESGGSGWAAEWTDHDGDPITLNFSTADPLNENVSAQYLSQGDTMYALREFATPLSASTIPELWSSIYLRPENLANGWMFGYEVRNGDEYGAICGLMYSENNYIRLGDIHAGGRVGDGSEFVVDQETMLVMRFYKNDPGDTVWNRVDLYADLDGTDGRYNNEVAIATGKDLGVYSPEELTHYRINQSGFLTDWDFVAVGTTKGDVIPEPITIGLLGLGALLMRRKR